MNKKVIVVSAINIFEGGTLNILLQVLTFANLNLNQYFSYFVYLLSHTTN